MIYASWGGRRDSPAVSRLGFGTTRFPARDLQDQEGRRRCVELVEHALDKGINYFDVSPTYANGHAESILGAAFLHARKHVCVAAKSGLSIDRTAHDLRARLDASLKMLQQDRVDFYYLWSVMDWNQYRQIMEPGGLFEGAMAAKKNGLIERLCISVHCDTGDAMRIVCEGRFDGILVSMNALNFEQWLPVVQEAKSRGMGVATMNSLAGGLIPRYRNLFVDLDDSVDSVPVKALRFLSTFDEIDVCLSGMASKAEIDENCSAFESELHESHRPRKNLRFRITTAEKLCTGCGYCLPCAVGIPIPGCMQAYNHRILVRSGDENVSERQQADEVFVRARANGVDFTSLYSCVSCRQCEKRCTQKINISERVHLMEEWAEQFNYTNEAILQRLSRIEKDCADFDKVAIWPSCIYATRLLDLWGNDDFESKCEYFNASSATWGSQYRGKTVHGPQDLNILGVGAIVVMNYRLQGEIAKYLESSVPDHMPIIPLHCEGDINWFDRFG